MKKLFLTLSLALASLSGYAQEWIDVTDTYVINPRFDGDDISTGWMGTPWGAYNPKENAEHYEKVYDTYQFITGLPTGKFRVSLQAFYRIGNASNDYSHYTSGDYVNYQYAQLYASSAAGDVSTPIVPASSAATENLGGDVSSVAGDWWSGFLYIPNNMEAAYNWFEKGYYQNTLECSVGNDGELTIGIRKEYVIGGDWTCVDNWKLEYWGTVTKATSVTLSKSSIELAPTEVFDLTATVLPQNATYRNVTWSSDNESVAIVDSKGQVTAVGAGTCNIIATAVDGSNKRGVCKVEVTENRPSASNIIINEIMAANVDVYLDPSLNFGSWVELYNPTSKSVALGGLYISDDPTDLKKHRLIDSYGAIPANGYALLNFDHHEVWTPKSYRQIDDALDCDGGLIIISDGSTIIAQQFYPEAISRVSYARTTDGGETWGTTGQPSPGASNQKSGGFASSQLAAPTVDKNAQLFVGTLQVSVNIPAGATLRYTTDGTTPTLSNGLTSATGLFQVTGSTSYRFRLFQDGMLPSPVTTRTYIYNEGNEPFPIISVVTDEDNLYDPDRGVFQKSQYGRPGNGQSSKCNWNMDWDRPVSFEYITTDNECVVSQECDFSMCGGWSRAWTPHSFKLKAKKTYDFKNTFEAKLFDEKPYLKLKTLQIRNGGNDTSNRIKDPALQQIVARSGLHIEYQSWQPVHVYFNGYPYAVLNMRETNNKDYAYSNYGIDTDEMDQFEMSPDSGYVQMRGTKDSFLRLIELSENAADDDTYQEICQLLDIDNYTNYMAVEFYVGATDWPQNNVKGFRDVNDGKFRFVLFDLDGAFGTTSPFSTFFNKEYYTFDRLYGYDYSRDVNIDGGRNHRQIEFVTLFRNMLQNDTFRKKFIDTFCIMGGSVFKPNHVADITNQMANYLNSGNYVNPFNTANDIINNLTASYNSNMMNQLRNTSAMQLSNNSRANVTLAANVEGAQILANGLKVPYAEFDGQFFTPTTLKAVAPAGYRFVGWSDKGTTAQNQLFEQGSEWKYYEEGSLDGKDWTAANYNDSGWKSGKGIIGYDYNNQHPDIATNVTNGNQSCYYFRKSFTLSNTPSASDEYDLEYTLDDGMVLYVNGQEVHRDNMPSGSVYYSTMASSYAYDNPNTGSVKLSGSLFKRGINVIAVEVHNNSSTSTDIMWDASLSATTTTANILSKEEEYIISGSSTRALTAIFEPLEEEEMIAAGVPPVRINEVSAANTIYVNDYFKKNDWIELYNTTDKDIDLAGMYISDNANKPEKYQVPSDDALLNTILPARSFKVVWCDKLDNIGSDIHTSFKLAAEGGDVLITSSSFADTLHYEAHEGTQTFGRYPDGANGTYVMNKPTISKANQLSSYDTLYVAPVNPEPEPDAIRSYTKEGGMTIAYVNGTINVKSENAEIRSIAVYSATGAKTSVTPLLRSGNHFAAFSVANLPRGIYIASAMTADGEECHIKFANK